MIENMQQMIPIEENIQHLISNRFKEHCLENENPKNWLEWLDDFNIIADYDGLFVDSNEQLTIVYMTFNCSEKERNDLYWKTGSICRYMDHGHD